MQLLATSISWRSHWVGSLVAVLAVVAPGATAATPPTVTFEPEAVVAGGLAPGAEVLLHGVARERHAYIWRLVTTHEVLVADATGVARLELPDGLAPVSIWTVADPVTGEFSIASPDGFEPSELTFPADGIARSPAGAWRVLRSGFERMEVLYLRPGVGAWWLQAVDGAGSDVDGREDSGVAVSLDEGRPFWGVEPPPDELAGGDVVVAVSLDTLEFFAARMVAPGPVR